MPVKTSKQYAPPRSHAFCDPEDIENGCSCSNGGTHYSCAQATSCEAAKGLCHLVIAAPGEPQLIKPDHYTDLKKTQSVTVTLPPGWLAFCVCLRYTGEEAWDGEKKHWPPATKWLPPTGYKMKDGAKRCGMPVYDGDWKCPDDDCYLVGVLKDGETQLVKLAEPGEHASSKDVNGYKLIFCAHLEAA